MIIVLAGLFGGTSGAFIDKFGLMSAYRISILVLSTSSLILGIYPDNNIICFLSPVFLEALIFS